MDSSFRQLRVRVGVAHDLHMPVQSTLPPTSKLYIFFAKGVVMSNRFFQVGLMAVLVLALTLIGQGAYGLNVPIQVKETAGVGATAFPVQAVVPLPEGS